MWQYPDESKCFFVAEQVHHCCQLIDSQRSHCYRCRIIRRSRRFMRKIAKLALLLTARFCLDQSNAFGYLCSVNSDRFCRFMGTYAASTLNGFASINFLEHNEEYRFTFPDAHAKGFIVRRRHMLKVCLTIALQVGPLMMELVGLMTIGCEQSGYKCELDFKSKPFFGGDYNAVAGKVKRGKETLFTISTLCALRLCERIHLFLHQKMANGTSSSRSQTCQPNNPNFYGVSYSFLAPSF